MTFDRDLITDEPDLTDDWARRVEYERQLPGAQEARQAALDAARADAEERDQRAWEEHQDALRYGLQGWGA